MKRRVEKDDNEPNERQKKSIQAKLGRGGEATRIINIYSFNSLS
jgi:hypothetical protein